jgi:tRNA(Ile)-lysidine synthase TilS/MesJ
MTRFYRDEGVDSMVIAKILSTIRASSTLLIDKIIAIHIDYANRPESGREAQYVEEYCNILNLTFEKRVINEVTIILTKIMRVHRF